MLYGAFTQIHAAPRFQTFLQLHQGATKVIRELQGPVHTRVHHLFDAALLEFPWCRRWLQSAVETPSYLARFGLLWLDAELDPSLLDALQAHLEPWVIDELRDLRKTRTIEAQAGHENPPADAWKHFLQSPMRVQHSLVQEALEIPLHYELRCLESLQRTQRRPLDNDEHAQLQSLRRLGLLQTPWTTLMQQHAALLRRPDTTAPKAPHLETTAAP